MERTQVDTCSSGRVLIAFTLSTFESDFGSYILLVLNSCDNLIETHIKVELALNGFQILLSGPRGLFLKFRDLIVSEECIFVLGAEI